MLGEACARRAVSRTVAPAGVPEGLVTVGFGNGLASAPDGPSGHRRGFGLLRCRDAERCVLGGASVRLADAVPRPCDERSTGKHQPSVSPSSWTWPADQQCCHVPSKAAWPWRFRRARASPPGPGRAVRRWPCVAVFVGRGGGRQQIGERLPLVLQELTVGGEGHALEGATEGAPLYVMTKQGDGRWLLHACQNTEVRVDQGVPGGSCRARQGLA
jgi:hypothetical protein